MLVCFDKQRVMKVFRKIRQNLFSKGQSYVYMKYAVGEVVLLVAGILIALWINSSYDAHVEKRVEKSILNKLLIDVESDFEQLNELELFYEGHLAYLNKVKTAFLKDQNDSIEYFLTNGYSGAGLQDVNPRKTTFDEMINSGKLYNLSNGSLTNLCIDYYEMFENNTYSVRQNRIEYRRVLYGPQMSDFWLLYLEIRELKDANTNSSKLVKTFLANKDSDAFKTLKQTTYWGVILIEINIKRLLDIKTKNRELYTMLSSQL